jgi:hypothetical protein
VVNPYKIQDPSKKLGKCIKNIKRNIASAINELNYLSHFRDYVDME